MFVLFSETLPVTGLGSLTDPLNRHTLPSSLVEGTSYVMSGTGLPLLPHQVGQTTIPLTLPQVFACNNNMLTPVDC